jgi:hypothetical protein
MASSESPYSYLNCMRWRAQVLEVDLIQRDAGGLLVGRDVAETHGQQVLQLAGNPVRRDPMTSARRETDGGEGRAEPLLRRRSASHRWLSDSAGLAGEPVGAGLGRAVPEGDVLGGLHGLTRAPYSPTAP